MRWAAPLLLILLTPSAAAWSAELVSSPSGVSLRESLLVAGALQATVQGGAFGSPAPDLVAFDAAVLVRMCPDQAGQQQPSGSCPGAEDTSGARLYVHAGGVILAPGAGAEVTLRSAATTAALGGPNVTLNGIGAGPGIFSGGPTVLTANSSTFTLRPLLSQASLEVRGDQGFRTYNGTGYTLYISGANTSRIEARGAFLAGDGAQLTLARAGVRAAEAGIRVEDLYALLRDVQPPERADRRADLAEAFGPFQLVPPLLDGALAARSNLTMNGAPRETFTFLRVEDARFAHDGANWTGSATASYLVDDDVLAPRPDAEVRFPVVIPILFVGGAIAARLFTHRLAPPRRARLLAHLLRVGGLVALSLLAGALLAPLLGFSPLLDGGALSPRSELQLALLIASMLGCAWLAVGLPSESLARSAFASRGRERAILVPVLVGLVAALVFLLLATPILLSFVARFVRL